MRMRQSYVIADAAKLFCNYNVFPQLVGLCKGIPPDVQTLVDIHVHITYTW